MSRNPFGGWMKAHDGLIATIVNQDSGELDTVLLRGDISGQGYVSAGRILVQADRLWETAYNTRVAWILSSGGTNWRPWTCANWN